MTWGFGTLPCYAVSQAMAGRSILRPLSRCAIVLRNRFVLLAILIVLGGCRDKQDSPAPGTVSPTTQPTTHPAPPPLPPIRPGVVLKTTSAPQSTWPSDSTIRHKILMVNSYHVEMRWTGDIARGVILALGVTPDDSGRYINSSQGLELRIFDLDTRRHPEAEYRKKRIAQARELIDTWKPNVLITSDDNAAAELVVPYYRNTALPVVFTGINWHCDEYGFPCKNVTGMLEVYYIDRVVKALTPYAKGNRVGVLLAETETAHKDIAYCEDVLKMKLNAKFARTFDEWKKYFIEFQTSTDQLIIMVETGIVGFDVAQAREFAQTHTTIPTGTVNDSIATLVLVGLTKYGSEQGDWAARTALKIIDSVPPSAIPIAENKRAHIYVNMKLAKKLGITLPYDLISQAVFSDTLP